MSASKIITKNIAVQHQREEEAKKKELEGISKAQKINSTTGDALNTGVGLAAKVTNEAAKTAAEKVATAATEKVAAQVAQKVAEEAALKVTEEAAKKVAAQVAQKAAEEVVKKAAEEAVKVAALEGVKAFAKAIPYVGAAVSIVTGVADTAMAVAKANKMDDQAGAVAAAFTGAVKTGGEVYNVGNQIKNDVNKK